MTIKEALKWAIQELKENDVSEPEASAEVLLFNVLEKNRAYLYAHGEEKLSKEQEKVFLEFIERRKQHEPVWYILGEVEFYGRKFKINNNVLTPRPETELLVKEVLSQVASSQGPVARIIELGTGAGGIIITLAKELESSQGVIPAQAGIQKADKLDSRLRGNDKVEDGNDDEGIINDKIYFIATDISKEALDVARDNAKRLGAEVEFLEGDLLSPIKNLKFKIKNSTIVANLPYIPSEDMSSLQFDVLHHEPRVALEGGEKGVVIYKRLIDQLKEIDFRGMAFFEIGIEQGELLKKYIKEIFPNANVEVKGDLANIDRIVIINFQ